MKDEKKYKAVNLMMWNEEENDSDVVCTSLTEEFTKISCEEESELYPDQNQYIGKPRYFFLSLNDIKRHVFAKENIDLFCKENPECYGEEFNVWNPDWSGNGTMVMKYKPSK